MRCKFQVGDRSEAANAPWLDMVENALNESGHIEQYRSEYWLKWRNQIFLDFPEFS